MLLPQKIIPYSIALLQATGKISTTFLSHFSPKSHDFLTRSLKIRFLWKKIFTFIVHLLCSKGKWYIVFDETEIDKSYARAISGLSWLYSHLEGGYIYGYQLVVIVLTNDKITIPVAWKFYKKNDLTKIELAIELLEYVLTVIPNPEAVIFDSLYSSEKMLKLLSRLNLRFFTQIAKNRTLNHMQVKFHNCGRPYWEKVRTLKGGVKVKVVKFRRKYFITNDTSLSGKQIRRIYKIRWNIETMFRFCKSELNMQKCQLRDIRSQNNNVGVCFYLYCVLEDNAAKTQMTIYQLKEKASLDHSNSVDSYLLGLFI